MVRLSLPPETPTATRSPSLSMSISQTSLLTGGEQVLMKGQTHFFTPLRL